MWAWTAAKNFERLWPLGYSANKNRRISVPLLAHPAPTLAYECPKTCPTVVILDTALDTTVKKGSSHEQIDVHRTAAQDRQRAAKEIPRSAQDSQPVA